VSERGSTLSGLDPTQTADVRAGLLGPGPKRLPARLLYDELGTALFEAISYLPEYGLTRADERILRRHAPAIACAVGTPLSVAELGSGTGRKTRWILEALARRQPTTPYYPIDISATALERCEAELGRQPNVKLAPIHGDYVHGLAEVAARRAAGHRLLVLFLGSTIGNFEPDEARAFLGEVRRLMKPGDWLLLGTDLVKPAPALLRAYDDPLGVTAAFNRNLLVRLNREMGAGFDLALFQHQARWREAERRIEMHLVARRAHEVPIAALEAKVPFKEGESIWTESSYKFRPEDVERMAKGAFFVPVDRWTDDEWPFAETLLQAR
jgi:L-histidine Nalpha-methyltransferase